MQGSPGTGGISSHFRQSKHTQTERCGNLLSPFYPLVSPLTNTEQTERKKLLHPGLLEVLESFSFFGQIFECKNTEIEENVARGLFTLIYIFSNEEGEEKKKGRGFELQKCLSPQTYPQLFHQEERNCLFFFCDSSTQLQG